MFAIVFVWTPPHFWALALMIKEHYARAGVPMLPVARGDARDRAADRAGTRSCSSRSTLAPVAFGVVRRSSTASRRRCSARVFALARGRAARARWSARAAVRLFHFSLLYLALLFVAMALDTVV